MQLKYLCFGLVFIVFVVFNLVDAEFGYDRILARTERLAELNMTCQPGRTVIKLTEKTTKFKADSEEESEEGNARRGHMNFEAADDETCSICVCAVDGKHEYCSKRPAKNVNECIRMATLNEKFQKNEPYEHERELSNRIRRDYLWHYDEIPYASNARCRRGTSYYTNVLPNNEDDNNNTDINDWIDFITERTDEASKNRKKKKDVDPVCLYCVCAVHGMEVSCLNRTPWFCEYYKYIRDSDSPRQMYSKLFRQDRANYFRTISYRVRRTMSDGIYQLLENVGNGLNKKSSCVPFLSEYSDCSEANVCTGCTRCTCDADGEWDCRVVSECIDQRNQITEYDLDNALSMITADVDRKRSKSSMAYRNPRFNKRSPIDRIVGREQREHPSLARYKRSSPNKKYNKTVVFHNTVDEINEDTLKSSNISGTLSAQKFDVALKMNTRRVDLKDRSNKSALNDLHIDYNDPQIDKHNLQITDNKIDTIDGEEMKNLKKEYKLLGNITQKVKNKELSKIVVGELKSGSEIIGDKKGPITSNVTFTPENDTLTAMAFIAGNLLNKLWDMEKDANGDSLETEMLKHEKIADLLELFREPLNLRQETFLKNALGKISEALNRNKNVNNISLCESLRGSKDNLSHNDNEHVISKPIVDNINQKQTQNLNDSKKENMFDEKAISKLNDVLTLMKKFDEVRRDLNIAKNKIKNDSQEFHAEKNLKDSENASLNLFGKILEKITKLMMPNGSRRRMLNTIKSQTFLQKGDRLSNKQLKSIPNVNLENVTLTAKDKLVLDYLSKSENKPEIILETDISEKETSVPNIEGDILLNLSEYFKIKSFVDLIKMVGLETDQISTTSTTTTTTTTTTTEKPYVPLHLRNIKQVAQHNVGASLKKFNDIKEKLKSHLKSIIEDLIDLQNSKGVSVQNGDIKINELLPCLNHILKTPDDTKYHNKEYSSKSKHQNYVQADSVDKIKTMFEFLKKDAKVPSSRRSGISEDRPISAIVWERTVKNLNSLRKNNRRSMDGESPEPFDVLNKMMASTTSLPTSFKKNALLIKVPPSDQLMLMKTLAMHTKQYVNVLNKLNISYNTGSKLSSENIAKIDNFINYVQTNIKTNDEILKSLHKGDKKNYVKKSSNFKIVDNKRSEFSETTTNTAVVKVTRDQVINQLIKNRVQIYLRIRRAKGGDLSNDVLYKIALDILINLERGNFLLARELFKIFVSQKEQKEDLDVFRASNRPDVSSGLRDDIFNLQKQPLTKFEEPNKTGNSQLVTNVEQDDLLKKLLNMNNM